MNMRSIWKKFLKKTCDDDGWRWHPSHNNEIKTLDIKYKVNLMDIIIGS